MRLTLVQRFWPKVRKTETCWLWQGANNGRYGQIYAVDRRRFAHRISWELEHGPIPVGLRVLHHCDTPACVRPSHLFLGTQADNMQDYASKGNHHQAVKTHCPQGHPYNEANTYMYRGGRNCRPCHKEVSRIWRTSQKEKYA